MARGKAGNQEAITNPDERQLHGPGEKNMSGCHYFATHVYLDRYMTNQTCTALKSLQNVTLCLLILDKARASAVQTLSWDPDGVSSRVSVLPRLES